MSALAAAVVAGAPAPARADGIALNRLEAAPAGDRMFGVPSPYAAGGDTPTLHMMLLGDWAHDPFLIRDAKGTEIPDGAVVGDQVFMNINASIAIFHRLNFNVNIPVAFVQDGESPSDNGQLFNSPKGLEFGDVRLGLRLNVLGGYRDPFQLAVAGSVWLPTSSPGAYVSDGQVRGMPQLVLGGLIKNRMVWSGAVGPEFRKSQMWDNIQQGTMLRWGGGFGFLFGDDRQLQIGPELNASVVLADVNKHNSNVEALMDVRYRFADDFEAGIGYGPGFGPGLGTATRRGVLMLAYTPAQKPPPGDRDHDGFIDPVDACPDVPGIANVDPKKNGCPASDRDRDGILDDVDACPDVPGVASSDPAKNGCPRSDRDGDGIFDEDDACPDVAGPPNADPKKNGCPPTDRDGDGIFDEQDACPDIKGIRTNNPATNGCPGDFDKDGIRDDLDACPFEKGKADPDPLKNGCPRLVRVTQKEIKILEEIQFAFDKSSISPKSSELLDEIAAVMVEHPEILKVEIEGHADAVGTVAYNKTLSQKRAEAVRKELLTRGIDADRLTAKGYGKDAPVADNDTEEGRRLNRRTPFTILERAKPEVKTQLITQPK
jgi:outer membrane protein OmpA-like peptidoglycan-associated protein